MKRSILKRIKYFLLIAMCFVLSSCHWGRPLSDASGTFEADEVIVSSEVAGKILTFNVEEGSVLKKDSVVGTIDAVPLELQRAQLDATRKALAQKTMDVGPQLNMLRKQIAVQQIELANALHEKLRVERLIKADAATTKQLDDLNMQIKVIRKQINVNEEQIKVQQTNVGTQNRSILSEDKPLGIAIDQVADQLKRTQIKNPIDGTVLTKYAMAAEVTAAGKALYKIADLSVITLRAYITGTQLSQVKLNQKVKVLVDRGADHDQVYPGVVNWIADKAEFTPKTIQTKDERANLVYAIKIRVKNDGYLKIGMYAEVMFN